MIDLFNTWLLLNSICVILQLFQLGFYEGVLEINKKQTVILKKKVAFFHNLFPWCINAVCKERKKDKI